MSDNPYQLRFISSAEEFAKVEDLQRIVWSGNETEVVPSHILISSVRHGAICIGAFTDKDELVGFVFGLPAISESKTGQSLMHYSHMLGVHPLHRNKGLGYLLKRAQWQMVRKQGVERITWTYDPLLSRNAQLNIAKLGAVCNTYHPNYYGELRDDLNVGIPTDRFEVDWWVNSKRVNRRLSKQPRQQLDLAHYLAAGAEIINPSGLRPDGLVYPTQVQWPFEVQNDADSSLPTVFMVEIPADYLEIKEKDATLALNWRFHTREIFTRAFQLGYLVTDFVFLKGDYARGFYILSHGEATL
ncbi:MAG: GNAT family N-acetyltransferase [Anaerolineales bacterium]